MGGITSDEYERALATLVTQARRLRGAGGHAGGEGGAKGYSRSYGESRLRHSSYVSLKRRLTEVGFILVANKERTQVTTAFPER